MTLVVGDADHLLGEPIVGKPQLGQFYIYDGTAFVPTDVADQSALNRMRDLVEEAWQKSRLAEERTIQTQRFLEEIVIENRIEIPTLEKMALTSMGHNVQLLFLNLAIKNGTVSVGFVNGFCDIFKDQSAIDMSLSVARHDADSGVVTPIVATSGLKCSVELSSISRVAWDNFQGECVYWEVDDGVQGHFEGEEKFFGYGELSDKGNGRVGFPAIGHSLDVGHLVRFYGFNHPAYNSVHLVDPLSTEDELVIVADYTAEQTTFNCCFRKLASADSSEGLSQTEAGMIVEFVDSQRSIVWMESESSPGGYTKIVLDSVTASQPVLGIRGVSLNSDGITISSGRDFDGLRNTSSIDAVPALTNSENVFFSSQTTAYEAYKVFDDEFGPNRRWLTAVNNTIGWITYNFGRDGKVINRYRWRTFESESNAVPGAWSLESSNDNENWTILHQGTNLIQTANSWIPLEEPGYFHFYNDTAFQYYRFHVEQNCGHPQYLCIDEIELVEAAQPVHPQTMMIIHTEPELFASSGSWDHVESVSIREFKPGDSTVSYAVSFDGGDSWSIFRDFSWRKILSMESGVWKFLDANGSWRSPEVNEMIGGLKSALSVSSNKMSSEEMAELSEDAWSEEGGWDTENKTIQFAAGMQASGKDSPRVSSVEITYTSQAEGLRLVGSPRGLDACGNRISASVLVKNANQSLRMFASPANPISWTQFGSLTKKASLAAGVDFYVTDEISHHESCGLRLMVECDNCSELELYGWAASFSQS